ncbi:MAG: ATP-binding protein [Paracoccaceae bacterium]
MGVITTALQWHLCGSLGRACALALAVFFLALAGGGPAAAQTMRVALPDYLPKSGLDARGEPVGVYPEIFADLAPRLGNDVVWVPCDWSQCLRMLRRGEVDILPDVALGQSRARLRIGREPLFQDWSQVFYRAGSSRAVNSLGDLNRRRVAVVRGGPEAAALADVAARLEIAVDIVAVDGPSDVVAAISAQRADAGIVFHAYAHDPARVAGLEASPLIFNPVSMFFGYSPTMSDGQIEAIERTLAEMKAEPASALNVAVSRWLTHQVPGRVQTAPGAGAQALAILLVVALLAILALVRMLARRSAALKENRMRLKAIFDHAPVEIYLKDHKGRYLEINKQFERLFGVTNDAVRGKLPADVHDPELAERTRAQDLEVLRRGETITREEVAETKGGTKVLYTIKFPLFDEEGEVSGIGAVVTDLTEQNMVRMRAMELERRLVDAVNSLPDGFVLFDADDRLVTCNERYREFYSLARPAIVEGARFEDIMRYGLRRGQFPEAVGREAEWLAERLEAHRSGESQFEQLLPEDRWLQIVERRTEDGGTVGFRVDITDLKRQQRAVDAARQRAEAVAGQLREKTRKLAQVVEISGIGGWEYDLETGEIYWDEITRSMYEVPDDFVPTPDNVTAFYDRASRAQLDQAFQACIEHQRPFDVGLELRTARGRRVFVRATGQAVVEDDRVVRMTGVFQNVTAQKVHEQALEASRLDAEKANVAKSQFLANMSHEIRTPMNGVTGMLALLLQSDLDKRQRLQAQTAFDSASGLMQILNDILDYSKLEANEMRIDQIEYSMHRVVDEVVAMLSVRAEEKGLALVTEVDQRVPAALSGDPARIRQVLVNLAGNAIKFTEEGEVVIRVGLLPGSGGRLMIEVIDSGIGISAEAQVSLFSRFAQADGTIGRRYGGTGLGLAISKQLVEALGGSIGVESVLGAGSRFWFTLPLGHPAGAETPPPRPTGTPQLTVVGKERTEPRARSVGAQHH